MNVPNSGDASDQQPDAALLDARYQYADAQQGYITTYIQLADTKCAWSFAAAAALIAYLLTNTTSSPLLLKNSGAITDVLALSSLLLLVSSATFAFMGIAPRLGSTRSNDPFFFGSVAGHQSSAAFIQQLAVLTRSDLVAARLRHNFDTSRICVRKYKCVKRSLWTGIAGVSCLGLALILNANKTKVESLDDSICPAIYSDQQERR